MWRIFKRSTRRFSVVDAIFERSSRKVEKVQRKYADFLNAKVKNWSPFSIKVLLVIFVLCYVSVTTIVLINAGSTMGTVTVNPTHQTAPRLVFENEVKPVYLTDRIKWFRHYLDSLKADKVGRNTYDSILAVRPGLIDSLTQLERLNK
ncbi:hypothetical protein CK934_23550 [Chitinophaga sp. MD30]|nr:hypothetical protein CK934_23550 [Chitinophaga sp. MD30]